MAANETTKERTSLLRMLSDAIGTIIVVAVGVIVASYLMWWFVPIADTGAHTNQAQATATAPVSNVGGQAPANVRGTNPESVAPAIVSTPISGIAQSEAEAIALYQTAVAAAEAAPIVSAPEAAPLPLNSAGEPVIDTVQQQQLDQSAQMAADEQQAAILAAQNADAASRAPDVSKADAEQMLHRDLCSVPRANPYTCDRGLFKPTPVQP